MPNTLSQKMAENHNQHEVRLMVWTLKLINTVLNSLVQLEALFNLECKSLVHLTAVCKTTGQLESTLECREEMQHTRMPWVLIATSLTYQVCHDFHKLIIEAETLCIWEQIIVQVFTLLTEEEEEPLYKTDVGMCPTRIVLIAKTRDWITTALPSRTWTNVPRALTKALARRCLWAPWNWASGRITTLLWASEAPWARLPTGHLACRRSSE